MPCCTTARPGGLSACLRGGIVQSPRWSLLWSLLNVSLLTGLQKMLLTGRQLVEARRGQIESSAAPSDGIGWDGIGEEAFELSWEAAGSE